MIRKRLICVGTLPRAENVFTSRSMVETVLSCIAMKPLTKHWLLTSVSVSDNWVSGGMTPNTCMTNLYLPPIPGGINLLVLLCPMSPDLSTAMFIKGISRVFGDSVRLVLSVITNILEERSLRLTTRSLNALLAKPISSLFQRVCVLMGCHENG